jgi:hypothetical protein
MSESALCEIVETVQECGSPKKRQRWLYRSFWCLLLSPILFFLLSNCWLRSPWGCRWIAGKITAKIGLEASIDGAGWLPGADVWIDGLILQQPAPLRDSINQPLLRVKKIKIRPAWSQALRGKKDLLSLTIDAPECTVSVEMIVDLIRQSSAGMHALEPQAPAAIVAARPVPETVAPAPAPPTPPTVVANPLNVEPIKLLEKPTGWLQVNHGDFRLLHAGSGKEWIECKNIDVVLPFEGKEAQGSVSMTSLDIFDHHCGELVKIPLSWKSPLWETPELSFVIDGLHCDMKAQLGKVAGLPFNLTILQKNQTWASESQIFRADEIEGLHRAAGYLLAPSTWNAQSISAAKNLSINVSERKKDFFIAVSSINMSGGVLQCADARALGDEVSLLGNGMLLADGRFAGILRIGASRQVAGSIESIMKSLFPELPFALGPFLNEDRKGTDLFVGGTVAQPWISIDQGANKLDAWKMYHHIAESHPLLKP